MSLARRCNALDEERSLVVNPEALLYLVQEKGGICAARNDILRELIGFKKIGADPYLDTIKVVVLTHEILGKLFNHQRDEYDYEEMDLYTLFIRRPPYEPETYPPIHSPGLRRPLIGSYVWFIKPANGSIDNWDEDSILLLNNNTILVQLANSISNTIAQGINKDNIKEFFELTGIIGYGKVRNYAGRPRIKLKALFIPSLLEHVIPYKEGLPEVRVRLNHQREIHIAYGIDEEVLKNSYKKVKQKLEKKYENYRKSLSNIASMVSASRTWLKDLIGILEKVASYRNIRYDVDNFSYVSYCASGHYMTTFPLAPGTSCPYCHNRSSSFCIPKYNGRLFSWRRQAFPKVYSRFNSRADFHEKGAWKVILPFMAVDLARVRILLIIDGIDMFVPEVGKVGVDFGVELESLLDNTNGVFIFIPDAVTKLLVNALLTSARQGCPIMDRSGKTNLLNLLLTKFIINRIGLFNLDSMLSIDPSKGVSLSTALLSKKIQRALSLQDSVSSLASVYNSLVNMRARSVYKKFIEYVENVLAHTIAHVLYILVREDPDIPEENIAYIYGRFFPSSGPMERIIYSGVYEKSKYGVLQLGKEIEKSLKDRASEYCHNVRSLTEVVQCMLVAYFEEAEKQVQSMQSFKAMANNALSNYPTIIANYRPWLSAGLADSIVNELRKLVKSIYEEFKKIGFELDFSSFNFVVMQKKEDIKSYLIEYIKNNINNNVNDEEIEYTVEAILREVLQNVILAEGPEYCLDGCYVNVHLEKMCTKAVEENLHVSWELLRLFLYLTGLLGSKPGSGLRPNIKCKTGPRSVKVTGRSILDMLRQASSRVKIVSAYVNTEAVKFIEELLKRGVSVSITIDERSCASNGSRDLCKELEQLKQHYGNLFNYDIASEGRSTHEKVYLIDKLRVYTSWNFLIGALPFNDKQKQGSRGPVAQSYIAEYAAEDEE